MSAGLRYHNPAVIRHLASQYVVMVMTPRVRARTEALRRQIPELDIAIAGWSDSLAALHTALPEKTPQADTWQKIAAALPTPAPAPRAESRLSFWDSLAFWRWTGLAASLASLVLAFFLARAPAVSPPDSPLVSAPPSYVAVMAAADADLADFQAGDAIRFVVNLYQKTAAAPSRLLIQWSESQTRTSRASMFLWARDRASGALHFVGQEPAGNAPWELDRTAWQTVSASSELIFTRDALPPTAQNTLFSGPCIQLGAWKQNTI